LRGGDQRGVIGKTQIIVAAKREVFFSIDSDVRALRGIQRAPTARSAHPAIRRKA
jgi:hypothetical protein